MKSRTGKPPGGLRPEDERLWQDIAVTLRPLKSRRAVQPKPLTVAKVQKPSQPSMATESPQKGPATSRPAAPLLMTPPSLLKPLIVERRIDEKTARKLQRGKVAIDARIDLHGQTEAQAHDGLLRFFSVCAARRQRVVLVITGKGERSGGLLRRSVPRWFSEPAFRQLVAAWRPAGPAHGGEGALYVRLTNPNRSPNRGPRP